MPNEKREPARVIDVRVRKHDRIDFVNGYRKREILFVALAALALKQSAVQENRLPRNTKNVTRASNLTRSADEFDLHGSTVGRVLALGRARLRIIVSSAGERIEQTRTRSIRVRLVQYPLDVGR
jgi:hypothetical protein